MAKYNGFVATIKNAVTGDMENVIFGPTATVKDIIDVLDEEVADMRPAKMVGCGFASSNNKKEFDKVVNSMLKKMEG